MDVQLCLPTHQHLLAFYLCRFPFYTAASALSWEKLLCLASHGLYLQIANAYLRGGQDAVLGTRGCRPCSLTAYSSPQRMPLRKQLRCWNGQGFPGMSVCCATCSGFLWAAPCEPRWMFLSRKNNLTQGLTPQVAIATFYIKATFFLKEANQLFLTLSKLLQLSTFYTQKTPNKQKPQLP